jgi:uncharacterized FlaG/YvyC family protein
MITDVARTEKLNQINVKEEGVYPSSPPSSPDVNQLLSGTQEDNYSSTAEQLKETTQEKVTSKKDRSKAPKLDEQISQLNSKLYRLNRELLFKVDKKINRNYISVVDKKTKEVIKEFPPKEIRNLMATLIEMEETMNPSESLNNILLNIKA